MRALLRFVFAIVPLVGIAVVSMGGCSSEVAAPEDGTVASAVGDDRRPPVLLVSHVCEVPGRAQADEIRSDFGTAFAHAAGCVGCGSAIVVGVGTGGAALIFVGVPAAVTCASCGHDIGVLAAERIATDNNLTTCHAVTAATCANECVKGKYRYGQWDDQLNECGCYDDTSYAACVNPSCNYGKLAGATCGCAQPNVDMILCGNGTTTQGPCNACPLLRGNDDYQVAVTRTNTGGGAMNGGIRPGSGGAGSYLCDASCGTPGHRACVGGTKWANLATPIAGGGVAALVSDPECPSTESGCLASPICCLQNSTAQHECRFVGRRSSTGPYCKCMSGPNNASCTSCDWSPTP